MMQNRIFFKRRYDKTAAAISEQLGLTHAETMNSKTVKGNEIDMLVNSLVNETRFRTTEGLTMYFNESDATALCDNVCRSLQAYQD